MTIAFLTRLPNDDAKRWLAALRAALPSDDIVLGLAPDAELAVVAAPAPGDLAKLPKLAFMQSAWAVGYGLAAIVVAVVMPIWGWRAVFFVGVLPAIDPSVVAAA